MTSEELKIIISAEIDKLKDALQQGQKETKDFAKEGESAGKKFGNAMKAAGKAVGTAMKAVGAAVLAAGAAVVGLAESTREYRTEQAKLVTAFETAGSSAEQAKETYNDLYRVLGDSGQATEAANHLAKLTTNQEDLAEYTKICQGVYATFGDSLPIESLTEAINETAKTGEVTGALADALNWAGISEDEFADKLFWANSEAEREQIIRETLNDTYSDAAEGYETTAASILAANEAQAKLTEATAQLGASVEPIVTIFKAGLATALAELVPHLSTVAEGFTEVITGVEGGAEKMTAGIQSLIDSALGIITDALPMILDVGVKILEALITGITESLPKVLEAILGIIPQILSALGTLIPMITQAILNAIPLLITTLFEAATQILGILGEIIPQILEQIVAILPQIIQSIIDGIPMLLQAAIDFLMAIVEAIPIIIPQLVGALPELIDSLLTALLENIPVLLEGAMTLFYAIIDAIPLIIPALVEAIPQIISSVIDFLIESAPMLLEGAITAFLAIVHAIPEIIPQLIGAIGQILGTIVVELVQKVPQLLKSIWDGVVTIFKNIPSFFSGLFKNAFVGIKSAFSGITGFFSSIWNGIKNIFSKVGATIGNAITNTVKKAINGVLSVAVKIINGFISAINLAISVINAIPGVSIKKLSKLEVPKLAEGGIVDGATLAMIGERGKEAVLPLENNTEWMDVFAARLAGMLGNDRPVYLYVDGKVFGKTAIKTINDNTRQTGKLGIVLP